MVASRTAYQSLRTCDLHSCHSCQVSDVQNMPASPEHASQSQLNQGQRHGVLLVAHGTRDAQGLAETLRVAEALARRLPFAVVEPCFLELAEPTISQGLARCVERGAARVTVLPLLLFAAGHAKRDIPELATEAARQYAGLELRQAAHLGCHVKLLELSELRLAEALAGRSAVPLRQTLLLMVGRGSSDAEAAAEMVEFSRLRAERSRLGRVDTCFVAMAQPTLPEALLAAADLPFARIAVQPHLLFSGDVLAAVREEVAQAALRRPWQDWLVAPHLGPHALLVEALAERSGLAL